VFPVYAAQDLLLVSAMTIALAVAMSALAVLLIVAMCTEKGEKR